MLLILSLVSCEKEEDFLPVPETIVNQPIEATGASAKSAVTGINEDVVKAFYDQLLKLQTETNFYSGFVEAYGPLDWGNILQFEGDEGGYVLSVPTKKADSAITTGILLFSTNTDGDKIKFSLRSEYDAAVSVDFQNASAEELFIYRNFYYNDLKSDDGKEPDEEIGTSLLEKDGEDEECTGGSFVEMCARITGGNATEHNTIRSWSQVGRIINRSLRNYPSYGTQVIDNFKNKSFNELLTIRDNINDGITSNDQYPTHNPSYVNAFNAYFAAREMLAGQGIGTGPSGVLGDTDFPSMHNQVIQAFTDCQLVFVHCWEDPRDFEIVIGGQGGGGGGDQSLYDPWFPNYTGLMFCRGVNDPFDTNGGPSQDNSTSLLHPNYDFCVIWQEYLETCIRPSEVPINNPTRPDEGEIRMYEAWAEFQFRHPEQFNEIIANPSNCVATDDLDGYSPPDTQDDCIGSLVSFMDKYDLDLTRAERGAIITGMSSGACGNQDVFNNLALFDLLNQTLDLDDNPQLIQSEQVLLEIYNFLESHKNGEISPSGENSEKNISETVANAFADYYSETGETEIDMGNVGDSDDVIWSFMKEAMLEAVKEAVADFIPGGTLALLGPELFANIQSGSWMDASFSAFEIVMNEADVFFPALKIVSAAASLLLVQRL